MTQYEYMTIVLSDNEVDNSDNRFGNNLNKYGKSGWGNWLEYSEEVTE